MEEHEEEEWRECMRPFQFDSSGWCIDDVRGGELALGLGLRRSQRDIDGFVARNV